MGWCLRRHINLPVSGLYSKHPDRPVSPEKRFFRTLIVGDVIILLTLLVPL
jgi:hypothetical protein